MSRYVRKYDFRFGRLLRAHRARKGLTLQDLADLLHVTAGYCMVIERGCTIPGPMRVNLALERLELSGDDAAELLAAADDGRLRLARDRGRPQDGGACRPATEPDAVGYPRAPEAAIPPTLQVLQALQALRMEPKTLARALLFAASAVLEDVDGAHAV